MLCISWSIVPFNSPINVERFFLNTAETRFKFYFNLQTKPDFWAETRFEFIDYVTKSTNRWEWEVLHLFWAFGSIFVFSRFRPETAVVTENYAIRLNPTKTTRETTKDRTFTETLYNKAVSMQLRPFTAYLSKKLGSDLRSADGVHWD